MMQDVVPKESRSIRNVSIERSRRRVSRPYDDVEEEVEQGGDQEPPRPVRPRRPKKSKGFGSKIIMILALIAVLVLGGMMLFSGAKVTVELREAPVFLDTVFDADKTGASGLAFDELTVTATKEKTIPATGTEEVNTRASGKIIVFNDYNSKPQKLITNTRFESPEGLIYRIDRSVVVPGQTEDADGKVIPGSIEVTAYADFPGEEYNIGQVDFTIPGLKNDPRYKDMFARSKTPMTGGFSGVTNVADAKELEATRLALQEELRQEALAELSANIPEGFVYFDTAVFESFNSGVEGQGSSDTVTVTEEIVLRAIIFNADDFAKRIAEETVADYDGTAISVQDFSEVKVSLVGEKITADSGVLPETLSLVVSGSPYLVWSFDEDDLRTDLAGQKKSDVDTVLEGYSGIESAEIVVRPFWNSTLPERTSRIKIKVQKEAE